MNEHISSLKNDFKRNMENYYMDLKKWGIIKNEK